MIAMIKKLNLKFLYVFKIFIMVVISFLISQLIISLQSIERDINTLPMSIIDKDNSSLSKSFSSTMRNKSNVNIIYDESIGLGQLASGEIDLLLVINEGYENQISNGEISDLFNVYSGYNPEYTKMMLEIISEEVLRTWVSYKIEAFNEDENIEIKWGKLDYDYTFIEIKEIIIDENSGLVINNQSINENTYEKITYVLVTLITSLLILLLLGEKLVREKLSGVLKRSFTFQPQSKKIYLLNMIIDVILIFIITSLIYSVALYINGVSIIQIISLCIIYLLYLAVVQIGIGLIIYLSNSFVIYNVAGFFFIIINLVIILISVFSGKYI